MDELELVSADKAPEIVFTKVKPPVLSPAQVQTVYDMATSPAPVMVASLDVPAEAFRAAAILAASSGPDAALRLADALAAPPAYDVLHVPAPPEGVLSPAEFTHVEEVGEVEVHPSFETELREVLDAEAAEKERKRVERDILLAGCSPATRASARNPDL